MAVELWLAQAEACATRERKLCSSPAMPPRGFLVNNKLAPSPFFHKNIILKEVKVLCFDRLLQVLILTDFHTYIFEI